MALRDALRLVKLEFDLIVKLHIYGLVVELQMWEHMAVAVQHLQLKISIRDDLAQKAGATGKSQTSWLKRSIGGGYVFNKAWENLAHSFLCRRPAFL